MKETIKYVKGQMGRNRQLPGEPYQRKNENQPIRCYSCDGDGRIGTGKVDENGRLLYKKCTGGCKGTGRIMA